MAVELAYINTKHPDFHDASLVSTLTKAEDQYFKPPRKQQHSASLDHPTASPAKLPDSIPEYSVVDRNMHKVG